VAGPVYSSAKRQDVFSLRAGTDTVAANAGRDPLRSEASVSIRKGRAVGETVHENVRAEDRNAVAGTEKEIRIAESLGQTDEILRLRSVYTGVRQYSVEGNTENCENNEGGEEDIKAYRHHLTTCSQERERPQYRKRGTPLQGSHRDRTGRGGRMRREYLRDSFEACATPLHARC